MLMSYYILGIGDKNRAEQLYLSMLTHSHTHIYKHTYIHTHTYTNTNTEIHMHTYVTRFWKTYQIVTLGLFHFIGPANDYTHTPHIQISITRLGKLVCFSRVSFADPVNSQLRQWDPWRVLNERLGSEIHCSDREISSNMLSKHVCANGWKFRDS